MVNRKIDFVAKQGTAIMEDNEEGNQNVKAHKKKEPLVMTIARPKLSLRTTIAGAYTLFFMTLFQAFKFASIQLTAPSSAAEHITYETVDRWPPSQMLQNVFDGSSEPKRLVVVATNAAYVYFADNFANSLAQLNVTNFVFVPLDDEAFQLLHTAYPTHTLPPPPMAESAMIHNAAVYGSKSFQALTSTRPTFLRHFLEKNITVLYNDVDMVWRRNAWDELDQLDALGNKLKLWEDGHTALCSCLLYLPANDFARNFLLEWESEIRSHKHNNDQPALGAAAVTLGIDRLWKSGENTDDVQIFSNSDEFPSGKDYFDGGSNRSRAVIIHNNWIAGLRPKRERFQNYGLWNLSGRLPREIEPPPENTIRAKALKTWTATVTVRTGQP